MHESRVPPCKHQPDSFFQGHPYPATVHNLKEEGNEPEFKTLCCEPTVHAALRRSRFKLFDGLLNGMAWNGSRLA